MRFHIWFRLALAAPVFSVSFAVAQTAATTPAPPPAAQQPAAESTAWPTECHLTRVANLPLTEHDGALMVPVTLNNTPLNFVVDTGGGDTAVSIPVANVLGLKTSKFLTAQASDVGGMHNIHYVFVNMLQMGRERARNILMMAASLPPGEDGILAPDLLSKFDVELDFGAMSMNVFRNHYCFDYAVYWTNGHIKLPFELTRGGHMRVEVKLEGKNVDAILDTGASVSALSFEEAARLFGLDEKSPGVQPQGAAIGPAGGAVPVYSYPFKSLSMGGVIVSNPHIMLTGGKNFLDGDDASLLLGMDVLRHLHLYIAYEDERLFITDAAAK
jgi:predicted aspartyl protease